MMNAMLLFSLPDMMGSLHPVLVHLPIGILLLAALFQWLSRKDAYQSLQPAIAVSLLLGMLSAFAACITGYLLAQSGDYDEDAIATHQWMGIATAIVAAVAFYTHKKNHALHHVFIIAMTLLIIITGHLGGSITHGSDYLTKAFVSDNEQPGKERKPIANIQEAAVYPDVIEPLLAEKCYSCHGPNKQKGKLRLDAPDFISKGGKTGKAVIAGNAGESELSMRLALPLSSEEHMPPKEKPQLTKQEVDLLNWWINSGASFDKQVKGLPQPVAIKHVLASLQAGSKANEIQQTLIPEKAVDKANDAALKALLNRGIAIVPVAKNSNYLSANFIAVENITAKDIALLEPIKQQLIWLKLGNTNTTDEALAYISKLPALTFLSLERTALTDKGLAQLNTLTNLQYLNVVGTNITANGLFALSGLKNIRQLFLYKTPVAGNDLSALKKQFPNAAIDTGGYLLPVLASDTTEVTEAPIKK